MGSMSKMTAWSELLDMEFDSLELSNIDFSAIQPS